MVKTIEDSNGIQDPVYFLGKKQFKTRLDRHNRIGFLFGKKINVDHVLTLRNE